MWIFRRKKTKPESPVSGPPCAYCRSTRTRVIPHYGPEQPNPVRTWRGQRYLTCRCLDCEQDFYAEETQEALADEIVMDEGLVDDEEALRAAEEELRQQVEDEDDRMCR